jgi:hypothetical protein
MREEIVGTEIFIHLDKLKVAAGVFASAAGAGFAIANHATIGREKSGSGERTEAENYAGGVATGISDEPGIRELV